MLRLIFQKILGNPWKTISLLAGSLVIVGMIFGIPVYTDGILQRMLTKDLENDQLASNRYPGYFAVLKNYSYAGRPTGETLQTFRDQYESMIGGMPIEAQFTEQLLGVDYVYRRTEIDGKEQRVELPLGARTSFPEHVTIVKGRMYGTGITEGILEVVASDLALRSSGMVLDRDYEVFSVRQKDGESAILKIRIVGVYRGTDPQDLYWYRENGDFQTTLMTDSNLLVELGSIDPMLCITDQTLVSAFDYHAFRVQDLPAIQKVYAQGNVMFSENAECRFEGRAADVIKQYAGRVVELRLTLTILLVPILLMILFYLFMVAQLSVQSESASISTLESRGAGRMRILGFYGMEALILGLISLAGGIPIGFGMVRLIGASNGFLEFIDRKALSLSMSWPALCYAIFAVLLFLATTLIPILIQSRSSIVQHRQRKSRWARAPFWKRFFLDGILLAASLYAFSRMQAQLTLQRASGMAGTRMDLDILLFLASTIFLFGAGLLYLRVHPWVLRLINSLGKKVWSPVPYATFHRLIRAGEQEQFIMLFLVLTLGIGLFNANAARTINRNTEDTIRCKIGADITLQEKWIKYDQAGLPINESIVDIGSMADDSLATSIIKYIEPDFNRFRSLPGIENATRIYREEKIEVSNGSVRADSTLMAIDPYDFGKTAWTRNDLNTHPMNEYLNVMIQMPNAVLVSSDLKEKLGLAVGDPIIYTVGGRDEVEGVVSAFIDFWPGYSPLTSDSKGNVETHSLVIAHLENMWSRTTARPYEVWLKRASGATDKEIYMGIEESRIYLSTLSSSNQEVIQAKNDPKLQGTNGTLTLGFLVSMMVCAIGFLIYWILSVQSRQLQFGVFRAMGLSRGSILGMLACEQGLISGMAVGAGILLGNLASALYVPLYQLTVSAADQPIPYRVLFSLDDSLRILLVFSGVLLVSFAILARQVLRIRIDQAVKLGEE